MKVANNAFEGLVHLNGTQIKPAIYKNTGDQILGKSGKTKAFDHVGTGGRIYLTDDQIDD
ncbi:MAG: hypothetical protein DWQ49_09760 [Bacteroidetes bacterium]|nr:MAG: hypothetical protein DWQ49_09760 [Bacteroidota bacterium]